MHLISKCRPFPLLLVFTRRNILAVVSIDQW